MGLKRELGTELAQEVLTDVAGTFFETRRRLEAMIETVEAAARRLRVAAGPVAGAAAALWRMLLGDAAARALLGRLGIDPAPFAAAARAASLDGPVAVPAVLGRRRRYAMAVQDAYRRLAEQVRLYQEGPPEDAGASSPVVYYNLLREMARLVNRQVDAVNAMLSPSATLQYVKQFNPGQMERERITGTDTVAGGLDTRMAFGPVHLEAMGLPVFPLLPPAAQAREDVQAVASAVFKAWPDAVTRLLKEIKGRR